MNQLVKELISPFLIDSKKKGTALLPGKFKPPHKGHLFAVEELLRNPVVGNVIVIISPRVVEGITPEISKEIWEKYLEKYNLKAEVRISEEASPVTEAVNLIKGNPEEIFYVAVGYRSEEDLDDINRGNFTKKYDNADVIVVKGENIRASNLREFIKNGNFKEFSSYLPDKLSLEEKKQIYNKLINIKPSILSEGKYDFEVTTQTRYIINQLKNNLDELYTEETEGEVKGIEYSLIFKLIPTTEVGEDFIISGDTREDNIITLEIKYNINYLPQYINDLISDIKGTLRHELEHLSQFNIPTKPQPGDEDQEDMNIVDYLTSPDEIEAFVQGLYKQSKTKKIPLSQAIEDYLDQNIDEFETKEDYNKVYGIWVNWAKNNLPKAVFENQQMIDELDKNQLETYVNKLKINFNFFIKAIKHENIETQKAFNTLIQASQGKIKLTPEDKNMIGEQMKNVLKTLGYTSLFILPGGTIVLILLKILKLNKFILPSSFLKEEIKNFNKLEYYKEYYKNISPSNFNVEINENKIEILGIQDKISLKESPTLAWNPKESLVTLSKYLMNELGIKEAPNIEIKEDEENAKNILGKTAYYNPSTNTITLYITGRHPKDILRSFSHEMIHHKQNLDGRLENITTTNTNEDDELTEIEREAYELGNILFRNWEDKIKND